MYTNEQLIIIKKDNTKQSFDPNKIKTAVSKSAVRVMVNFTEQDLDKIVNNVLDKIRQSEYSEIHISLMHNLVEKSLEELYPAVAKSYKDYRNYKQDFIHMLDDVYKRSQSIMYIGDKENSNSDSALVSTKRSLIFNELNKALYKKFFLTTDELQAFNDGYIYIHDSSARRDTMNCCLFDLANVLKGGFEMGNIWYNEPKTLSSAFNVIGDVVLSTAAQQYGGFTLPEIDKILGKYAKLSYEKYLNKYLSLGLNYDKAQEVALSDLENDFTQGWQGIEYKFNTVGSSRGDYPFIAITIGLGTDQFSKMAAKTCLQVRAKGQGEEGKKRPVLFPKIVFLYDENLHGENKVNEDLFEEGVLCSSKTMYPDWLSLTGEGYVCDIYKKYKEVISPMGCRAFLSPWYEKGGMYPLDETDKPVYVGRFNIGAISLHLPMILEKSRKENKDFHETLDYYLEMIRQLHIRTYNYLGEMRASTNPLAYCQGGFYGGNLKPNEKIKPILKTCTASFGFTALNELQMLYNNKTLVEDGEFAIKTLEYINEKVLSFKNEDKILYAIYATPAESLCGLQVEQFRSKYGIVEGVSDKPYVSNSFHCHVTEDITPIQKQDLEKRFWNLSNGGKIQYVKYPINYNVGAIKSLIKRAMKMGFYEGVNLSLSYCGDCGHQELNMNKCPQCSSTNLTKIERMNGYLSYSRVSGDTRLNDAKMAEIAERKSM
ncbi:anaerobic ribonucleoside-triphosphate reductase [Malacoplasma penetrans]|nr:anaerobic ribonucleoside-triphosphate reductase [Malacoplasma penetrans]RXY96317.1 anaerobic ribonucleoside-triphosphate reductase [Malacoplasma penetrans]